MKLFDKAKKAYAEKKAERAELQKVYREEYAKEKALQESGRSLAAREEARDRARAKARAPAFSERMKKGAGQFASGVGKAAAGGLKKLSEMDKQPAATPRRKAKQEGAGIDFLGVGGGSTNSNMFSGNSFGGANFFGTSARKKKKGKRRSQPDFGGFF